MKVLQSESTRGSGRAGEGQGFEEVIIPEKKTS